MVLSKTYVVYEPRGKAREYSPLAANLYSGCSHQCKYCYAPATLHKTKEKFYESSPREDKIGRAHV